MSTLPPEKPAPAESLANPKAAPRTHSLPPAAPEIPRKRHPDDSQVVLAHIMSDHETNWYGTVHGGVILKLVDEAGGAAAGRHAGMPAVTVAMERVNFHKPTQAGDLLTITARVANVGRTSIDVIVTATATRWNVITEERNILRAHMRFVAINAEREPQEVPRLIIDNADDEARAREAQDLSLGR